MDFSSPSRALLSLDRRRPALPEEILAISKPMFAANTKLTSQMAAGDSTSTSSGLTLDLELKLKQEYLDGVYGLLAHTEMRWEALAVGLYCGTELLEMQMPVTAAQNTSSSSSSSSAAPAEPSGPSVYMDGPRMPSSTAADGVVGTAKKIELSLDQTMQLSTTIFETAMENLEHTEPRIRTLVAKAVGAHAAWLVSVSVSVSFSRASSGTHQDDGHYKLLQQQVGALHIRVSASIKEHMQQGREEFPGEDVVIVPAGQVKFSKVSTEVNAIDNDNDNSTPKSAVLDDTTGWRALETNWQCLACLVQPLGGLYLKLFPLLEGKLLDQCQKSAIEHVNRHVRAAAMLVLEQWIVSAAAADSDDAIHPALVKTVTAVLKEGLADNWSQVRMAASVLCRVFFLKYLNVHPPADPQAMHAVLIPRMCFNRFYLAQGVKLYSHDSWRQVFQDTGLQLVTQNVGPICRYYIKMCDANNHVVREGACQAVAELATKLSVHAPDQFQPYVSMLLQALLMCFHDESWPVRDEASLACGLFCKAYPDECREELNMLWERWTEQLTDQIWSVRENAAVALGDAVQAYGKEIADNCLTLVKKLLPSAKDQQPMTMEEYKDKQNDIAAHTDAQLYSCGSLAPKMSKKSGAGRIGCGNCGVTRPKAPWEATDGCVYLLRELTTVGCGEGNSNSDLTMTDEVLLPLLTELADVCRVQHFPQGDDLRATLWRQLPSMAMALGKQRFKRLYLDIFLDLLMSNLQRTTASALSKHAAGQCAEELAQLVGTPIFRGRLDDYQQVTFDKAMQVRQQQMPRGPVDSVAFSPFGPPGMLDSFIVSH